MFKFRLEPLITIRDNKLKERQRELAKAYEARRIVVEAQQKIEQELEEGQQSVREMSQSETIDVNFLLAFQRHKAYRLLQLEKIQGDLKQIDEEIARRRAAMIDANKDLKIVEKLKEKRYDKYLEEENNAETKVMDEISARTAWH